MRVEKKNNNEKSVEKNAILNVMTTLFRIVFPLITYPYITRILQVNNLGKINYASSIVSYYSLFAALGISTYAIREGARHRNDRENTEKFASEVFSINVLTTLIAYIVFILSIIFIKKFHSYSILLIIESLTILFTTIGVDWINIIYEDYAYIALRSLIVQILSLVALFVFVHQPNDYYIYAIITVGSQGIISILNILHVRKYCEVRFTLMMNIKQHTKPIMVLFSNNLAVSIYVSSDTTMLGWMVGDYYVGLYSVSVRIYNVVKQLLAALYNVMIARMSFYYANGDIEGFKNLLNKAINTIIVFSIPATCGLICIAKEAIFIISGNSYINATASLQILSLAFFFAIMGGVVCNCVNLPLKRERTNLFATSISAVVNITLNVVLIPLYKQNAAALTTLISEVTVAVILFYSIRDHYDFFDFKEIVKNILKSSLAAGTIFIFAYIFKYILRINGILYLISEAVASILGYFLINMLLKNKWIRELKEILKIRKA